MRKSTIAVILAIYVASIVAIGFYGISIKVYDKVKYVESIELKIEAENDNMYSFVSQGKSETGDNKYYLKIHFKSAHLVDGAGKEYLPISIVPYVTYDSGDVAGNEEKIKFTLNSSVDFVEKGKISFDNGQLVCYDSEFVFYVTVSPEQVSKNGSSATVKIYVAAD